MRLLARGGEHRGKLAQLTVQFRQETTAQALRQAGAVGGPGRPRPDHGCHLAREPGRQDQSHRQYVPEEPPEEKRPGPQRVPAEVVRAECDEIPRQEPGDHAGQCPALGRAVELCDQALAFPGRPAASGGPGGCFRRLACAFGRGSQFPCALISQDREPERGAVVLGVTLRPRRRAVLRERVEPRPQQPGGLSPGNLTEISAQPTCQSDCASGIQAALLFQEGGGQ